MAMATMRENQYMCSGSSSPQLSSDITNVITLYRGLRYHPNMNVDTFSAGSQPK